MFFRIKFPFKKTSSYSAALNFLKVSRIQVTKESANSSAVLLGAFDRQLAARGAELQLSPRGPRLDPSCFRSDACCVELQLSHGFPWYSKKISLHELGAHMPVVNLPLLTYFCFCCSPITAEAASASCLSHMVLGTVKSFSSELCSLWQAQCF